MAFSKNGIARIGSSQVNGVIFTVWAYNGTQGAINDTLATINASGYFNPIVGDLSRFDRLHVTGTDGSELRAVDALTPNVTTSPGNGAGILTRDFQHTTAGGSTVEVVVNPNILASDSISATVEVVGPNTQVAVAAIAGAGDVTLTFIADPGVGCVVRILAFSG